MYCTTGAAFLERGSQRIDGSVQTCSGVAKLFEYVQSGSAHRTLRITAVVVPSLVCDVIGFQVIVPEPLGILDRL